MTTLAELRLANLREQKKSAQEPAETLPEPAPAADTEPAALDVPTPEPSISLPAPTLRGDDLVLAQYVSDTEPLTELADPEDEKSAALIVRVHECLTRKTMHPTGAKATVDMSPALFHRAKRYCLDHGNVTLRQLFLDLMTAFLDEEGY